MKTLFFQFTDESTVDNPEVNTQKGYTELSFHNQRARQRSMPGVRHINPDRIRDNTFNKLKKDKKKKPGPFGINPLAPNMIDPFFGRLIH